MSETLRDNERNVLCCSYHSLFDGGIEEEGK